MSNEAGLSLTGIRVLVRLPKIEKMSKGGIALPDYTHDRESKAQVTGVFIDAATDARDCSEIRNIASGDTVFFARYAGAGCEFSIAEVPYRVMNATDIIGKLEDGVVFDGQFRAAETPMAVYGTADQQKAA